MEASEPLPKRAKPTPPTSLLKRKAPQGGFLFMPKRKKVILRYADLAQFPAVAAGAMSTLVYRANSVFDPNKSGAGHQPMGFDTWASLYNHYIVTKSEIRCTIRQDTNDNVANVWILDTDDDGAPTADWHPRVEVNNGDYGLTGSHVEGNSVVVMQTKYAMKKEYPVEAANLVALVTANPTEVTDFNISRQAIDQATDTISAYAVMVEIVYEVEFFEPKDLTEN